MAAPAIGRRSPLVSAFFCPSFSFSFFRSLRPGTLHKPFQYIFIYFSLPSPRLLEQLLAPRQPKSRLRPSSLVGHFLGRPITFRQPPSYTPIYSHHSFVRRPFIVDSMLDVSPRPILWKTWWDQSSDSVSQASPTPTQEPHSSPGTSEPAVFPLHQSHNPWTSWSLFLITPVDTKSGHTALNPFSSLRNETFASLTPNRSVSNPLSHSHAPTNSDPAEITCLHFVSCIYNPHSLAQPATSLFTPWKGEIEHESWGIYFLSKLLHFISFLQPYAPS